MWSVEPSQPVGLPDDRPLREIDLWAALARNVWNAAHGHSLMRRSVFKSERALACVVRERTFASLRSCAVTLENENGLESTDDRGSFGMDGNQHVRLRGALA
jgi:hypothetical protein